MPTKYLIYVGEYLSKTILNSQEIQSSSAKLTFYLSTLEDGPLLTLDIPFEKPMDQVKPMRYWSALCIDGDKGLSKVIPISQLSNQKPDISVCDDVEWE